MAPAQLGSSNKPISVDVLLDNQPLRMELDTGATRSLISEAIQKQADGTFSVVCLRTYSGEILKVVAEVTMVVLYGDQ